MDFTHYYQKLQARGQADIWSWLGLFNSEMTQGQREELLENLTPEFLATLNDPQILVLIQAHLSSKKCRGLPGAKAVVKTCQAQLRHLNSPWLARLPFALNWLPIAIVLGSLQLAYTVFLALFGQSNPILILLCTLQFSLIGFNRAIYRELKGLKQTILAQSPLRYIKAWQFHLGLGTSFILTLLGLVNFLPFILDFRPLTMGLMGLVLLAHLLCFISSQYLSLFSIALTPLLSLPLTIWGLVRYIQLGDNSALPLLVISVLGLVLNIKFYHSLTTWQISIKSEDHLQSAIWQAIFNLNPLALFATNLAILMWLHGQNITLGSYVIIAVTSLIFITTPIYQHYLKRKYSADRLLSKLPIMTLTYRFLQKIDRVYHNQPVSTELSAWWSLKLIYQYRQKSLVQLFRAPFFRDNQDLIVPALDYFSCDQLATIFSAYLDGERDLDDFYQVQLDSQFIRHSSQMLAWKLYHFYEDYPHFFKNIKI